MRRLQHLRPAQGAKKDRKRRGCGLGTGNGGTAGKGHKGQKARSTVHPWFEGGQMPIQRRMTHKGFSNARHAKQYQVVNIGLLEKFEEGTVVTPELMKKAGMISSRIRPVKILGDGKLTKNLTVCADAYTESALKAITEAGGTVEVLS
ncbi:MAG TPA: 50S ribosomal protein L15 [Candidatus Sabulitectum sp.]|nr:50S ribosomal protein L15 [Candidatus Sabulitectum sp.]HPF31505.1 50S ribosomal protein L15 [Candidatus Sabulitectum sp.]HPJ27962.1 50S ribosomal protein L15 [Candidatus Sabulitectum sp.]HPR21765.1 50S ribosomal protein L15 [Candidatus Sabulitectum sp.]HRW78388.1 50S ribosomal protein L15 [Candidatus Sabulitectum sp.]